MTLEPGDVDAALSGPRALLAADGGNLVVDAVDGVVEVRLELRDASCAECVLPRAFLEPIVAEALREHLGWSPPMRLVDPRD